MMKRVIVLVVTWMLVYSGASGLVEARNLKSESVSQDTGFVLPILKRDSLLNGLHLMVLEQRGTGSVTARLRINSGGMFDLANKGGLADLTAGMLLRGGGGLTGRNVLDLVEQTGLKVNITAGWDSTDITVSGPAETLDTIFELLGRLVITPTFDQKELDSLKAERISSIKGEASDESQLVSRKALEAVYGSHPYGRPLRGTAESIERITRPDLTYFHGRFYIANNSELIITGDATAETVTQLARGRLGAWKKGDKVPATFRPPEPAQTRRLILNDRPGAGVAYASLTQMGVSRRATDYFAAMIMGEILAEAGAKLAGTGSSIEARVEARYLPGPLRVNLKAAPGELVEKIEGVIALMASLKAQEAPLEQIEAAKARIINRFAERLRSVDGASEIILDIELYGLGRDYLVNFVERVKAVAPADVLRAAQTYLKPQLLVIVVAGPADKLEPSLKRLGAVTALP